MGRSKACGSAHKIEPTRVLAATVKIVWGVPLFAEVWRDDHRFLVRVSGRGAR